MIQLIIPGPPMVKKRPIVARKGGVFVPKEHAAHEQMIAWYARACGHRFPPDARLSVRVRFFTNVRKQSLPDLDNLLKAVLDGLQKGELFRDDSQVVEILAWRFDGQNDPHTEVTVDQCER